VFPKLNFVDDTPNVCVISQDGDNNRFSDLRNAHPMCSGYNFATYRDSTPPLARTSMSLTPNATTTITNISSASKLTTEASTFSPLPSSLGTDSTLSTLTNAATSSMLSSSGVDSTSPTTAATFEDSPLTDESSLVLGAVLGCLVVVVMVMAGVVCFVLWRRRRQRSRPLPRDHSSVSVELPATPQSEYQVGTFLKPD